MTAAHLAVELEDLTRLAELLDDGADIHEEHRGRTLLHHAIDVEADSHTQSGEPLRADTTAYLLARGADPRRRSGGGTGVSAVQLASTRGHWRAARLIREWLDAHPE